MARLTVSDGVPALKLEVPMLRAAPSHGAWVRADVRGPRFDRRPKDAQFMSCEEVDYGWRGVRH
jgi:hypothetical protein